MSTSWSDIIIANQAPAPMRVVPVLQPWGQPDINRMPLEYVPVMPGSGSAVAPYYGHGQVPGLLPTVGVACWGHQ